MEDTNEINTVNFNDELTSFADDFSKKYKDLSIGTYKSERDIYTIKYLNKVTDFGGRQLNTVARIGHDTGNIELDHSKLMNPAFTSDFVYFIILWCWAIIHNPHKEAIADKITMDFCFSPGHTRRLSKKNILNGFATILRVADTQANRDRMRKLTQEL